MRVIMVTGRTIRQGENIEQKHSEQYSQETSTCFMNPLDMLNMYLEEGDNIRAVSDTGQVVFKAFSDEGLKQGTIFIPYGPYCNMLISTCTHGTGMPDYKSSVIEIESTDEDVKPLIELLSEAGGRGL